MTYPAESVQIGYQNHVEDIRSFLDSRHADHYTVFNLSQRNYRGAKFSNRVSLILPHEAITDVFVFDINVVIGRCISFSSDYYNTRVRYEKFDGYFWSANI